MALSQTLPESIDIAPGNQMPELAPVLPLHPPEEGVFDSGAHYFYRSSVEVGNDNVIWTLEIPENLAYQGLAVFVPGYSGIKGSSIGPRTAMANEGFATITYSPARKGGSWYETINNPQILHAKTIRQLGKMVSNLSDELKNAPNIKQIANGQKLLLPHSMGGLGATEYASHAPDDVDAIYKLAAVGYGHPTLLELAQDVPKGMHKAIWHELIPSLAQGDIKPTLRNVRDLFNYFGNVRALLEGNNCLRHDSREQIAELRSKDIFIAYQAYQYDILVRPDSAIKDHVDHHEVLQNAGHLAPIYKPKQVASRVAAVINAR